MKKIRIYPETIRLIAMVAVFLIAMVVLFLAAPAVARLVLVP